MLKLLLTKRAEISLEEITDYYLTRHSVNRTKKVIKSLEEAFEKILASPHSYAICFDIEQPQKNTRQMIVHNTFKVIYRIEVDKIIIIEVFHGSRNPDLLKYLD